MCLGKVVKIRGTKVSKLLFLMFLDQIESFSDTCYDPYDLNLRNRTIELNRTLSPADEYYRSVDSVQFFECGSDICFEMSFRYRVLQMSSTINDVGSMRWELVACAAIMWIIVYFCIWKGVKSAGKVSHIVSKLK